MTSHFLLFIPSDNARAANSLVFSASSVRKPPSFALSASGAGGGPCRCHPIVDCLHESVMHRPKLVSESLYHYWPASMLPILLIGPSPSWRRGSRGVLVAPVKWPRHPRPIHMRRPNQSHGAPTTIITGELKGLTANDSYYMYEYVLRVPRPSFQYYIPSSDCGVATCSVTS